MRIILVHIFYFLSLVTYSQESRIQWGDLEPKSGYMIELLPFHGKDFYSLRWRGGSMLGSYYLTRHDDLETSATDKIAKSINNSIADFETVAIIDEHPSVFLSDKRDGKEELYLQEYGYDLKPRGDATLLVQFEVDKGMSNVGYNIIQSKDRKYFAIFWLIEGKRKDKDIYGFSVFNSSLEKISSGEYELPFESQFSDIITHYLTNKGDYFLAVKEFEMNNDRKIFQSQLKYKAMHIYQVNSDGLEDYIVPLNGRRVEAISIDSDDKGQFLITGVFGEESIEGVKGLFYLKLNYLSKQIVEEGFEEFKKDFITEDWSQRDLDKAQKREDQGKGAPALYDYKIKDIHILEDGSIAGSIEQNYVLVRSFSDSRGVTTTTYTYYYNDIIAFKIGENGGFEWLQKIKKMQISTNDGGPYSSYSSHIDGNRIVFIFNDSRANYDEKGDYVKDLSFIAKFTKRDNVVAITEVELTDGSTSRKSLFTRKEIGTLAIPKMFQVDVLNKEMLLYATFRNKERYGYLKFD